MSEAALPVSDEISSLSAIMLDDDYYQLMLSGRRTVDGISVLGAEHIILFKMRAWLDLTRRKLEGLHVNSQDLTKHKRDVFRLYAVGDPRFRILLPEKILNDATQFIEAMRAEPPDMKGLGLGAATADEVLDSLRRMYTGE